MKAVKMTEQILPQQLSGLGAVMDNYDGVILDLWGVVHNGMAPFSHTLATLAALRTAGKEIWLLSNAPRRVAVVQEQLGAMGVTGNMYDGILTSGEAGHDALKSGLLDQWGPCCLHLGQVFGEGLTQGLACEATTHVDTAHFILATGVPGGTLDANRALLEQARARNLPMLCANPDRVVHVGHELYVCPGTLAQHYEELGGQVAWFGKPYGAVYERVLAQMPSRRILAVGDGMPTDVKGAVDAGLDVALVTAGIHRDALFGDDLPPGEVALDIRVDENRLERLMAAEGVKPSFIINGLAW